MTVGEANGVTSDSADDWVAEDGGNFNTDFSVRAYGTVG